MTNTGQHGEASVRIVPSDPAWPSLFQQERSLLEAALGKWLAGPVEHFGSTAVPRLAAKPVIDIMAGVESLDASRDAIAAAGGLGYVYYPSPADVMHWFCKPSAAFRTHHCISCRSTARCGSSGWRSAISCERIRRWPPSMRH